MEITLGQLIEIVPGLIYAVIVILIYREGSKELDKREEKLREQHNRELDRLTLSYNARVEGLQTIVDKLTDRLQQSAPIQPIKRSRGQ